jgi:hypothetical protein
MAEREDVPRPDTAPTPLATYLGMTTPRSRAPMRQPPPRHEQQRVARSPIDNRDLGLEEGNDFA